VFCTVSLLIYPPTWNEIIAAVYPCSLGPCHYGMVLLWIEDVVEELQMWRLIANLLNKKLRTAEKGDPQLEFWARG
jgi:hypothetical protein